MLTLTVVFGASTTLWQGHSVVEICGGLKSEEAIAFYFSVCLLS